MGRLSGHTAIVTGSSSGIGQGIAERLAKEGAGVVIDYRSTPQGADETLKRVEAAGGKGIVVQADVSKLDELQHLVDQAWSHFGGCDILANNAGIEKRADFWDATE